MQFLEGHSSAVLALAFSPDGKWLASGGKEGQARLFDLTSSAHRLLHTAGAEISVTAAAWAPDSRTIAIAEATGAIELFDIESAVRHRTQYIAGHGLSLCLAFCNRGNYLVIGHGYPIATTDPGAVDLFDRKRVALVKRTNTAGSILCIAAIEKKIIYSVDRRVVRWNLTESDSRETPTHSKPIRAVALAPDARTFAATDDYAIQLYNADTMQRLRTLTGHKGRVDSLAFAPDGRYLLSGAWDKTVRLWDVDAGREVASHDWDIGNVRTVAVSPDGTLAAAGGDRGTIVLWDLDR